VPVDSSASSVHIERPPSTAKVSGISTERERITGAADKAPMVRVVGVVVAPAKASVWITRADDGNRAGLASVSVAPPGDFCVYCSPPVAHLSVRIVGENGLEHVVSCDRPQEEAYADWDLGRLELCSHVTRVTLTLQCEAGVLRRMLASRQRVVVVELRYGRSNGALLGTERFNLSEVSLLTDSYVTKVVDVSLPKSDAAVSVTWTCSVPNTRGSWPTLRREELLGVPAHGVQSSVLRLVGEEEVRGAVVDNNGRPCNGVDVVLTLSGDQSIAMATVESGPRGEFSFHVGPAASGVVGLSGTIQLATAHREEVRVASGVEATLRMAISRIRFRLVGPGGQPITDYQVRSRLMRVLAPEIYNAKTHRDGVSWIAREDAEQFPWLAFDIGDEKNRVFLVPPTWMVSGDMAIHDVPTAQFVPDAPIQIVVSGDNPSWKGVVLELRGVGELGGLAIDLQSPSGGRWQVDNVPSGQYEYSLRNARNLRGGGTIVVSPDRGAVVSLNRL
jgi:hypothetical protein